MNRDVEKEINKYPTYLQWRTQDFTDYRERGNHKRCANLLFGHFFPENCMERKEIGRRRFVCLLCPSLCIRQRPWWPRLNSQGPASRSHHLSRWRSFKVKIFGKISNWSISHPKKTLSPWCHEQEKTFMVQSNSTPRDSGQVMYNFLLLSQSVKSANILCGKFYLSHT